MLASLHARALAALLLFVAGAGCGAVAMAKWDARAAMRLAADLADARRTAARESAVRNAIQEQCDAADAAVSAGADLADNARRVLERANQELDHATDDSDPLRAQLDRLRRPAADAARSGSDPAATPGGVDPLPGGP